MKRDAISTTETHLRQLLAQRILILDGAMGTMIQRYKLTEEDYYVSEEGFIVFTEAYHLKRGYCCKSNCKHCPYGYNSKTGMITK